MFNRTYDVESNINDGVLQLRQNLLVKGGGQLRDGL